MRRKRKLKKTVKLILGCLIIIVISLFLFNKKDIYQDPIIDNKVDYVSKIVEYDDTLFNSDFLKWIDKNYENALEKIFLSLNNSEYDIKLWHELTGNSYIVLQDHFNNFYVDQNNVKIIDTNNDVVSIGFAGDVSLADNWAIMPYYKTRNQGVYGILSENMVSYMEKLDWMIVNSEFAFSNRGAAMKGKQYTFRASPEHVNIYKDMHVDMVTLANNHVYDYGAEAFYDTLSVLRTADVPYIGAGENNVEAESAFYLVVNGYKIAFLNATRAEKYILTPEATENSPGVFRCYDPTRLSQRIKEEKENSDFVVVIVHWGKETYHTLENVQMDTGKIYIDSGADLVVGHHAHVLQGVEFYKGKLIVYNLGNFIFNSLTVDTGILKWEIDNNGESKYYFYPGLQKDCYTSDVSGAAAADVYSKMSNWSINADFLDDGRIVERIN